MKFHSKSTNNQGLGVSALARRWGVHPNTVRRYINTGNVRALCLAEAAIGSFNQAPLENQQETAKELDDEIPF